MYSHSSDLHVYMAVKLLLIRFYFLMGGLLYHDSPLYSHIGRLPAFVSLYPFGFRVMEFVINNEVSIES